MSNKSKKTLADVTCERLFCSVLFDNSNQPPIYAQKRINLVASNDFMDVIITLDLLYRHAISKLVLSGSQGEYELKEATMYSSLKRLEHEQDITAYWGNETQGGRRRYYKITAKGKQTYVDNKQNWEHTKRILDNLL